jgi:Ser/Thr protein kinase RdoA (MazF antagonist)
VTEAGPIPLLTDELAAPFEPLSESSAAGLLADEYAITTTALRRLPTERDDTFLVSSGAERYVLKVAHPADDPAVVDLQVGASTHAAAADPSLPLSGVLTTVDGRTQPLLATPAGPRIARLLTYLPGRTVDVEALTAAQRGELGEVLARLATALQGFRHPAQDRVLAWDLQHLGSLRHLVPRLPDRTSRQAVTAVLDRFDAVTGPRLRKTRRQVLHNDLNPDNVLADPGAVPYVTGVLDFGDTVRTYLAVDLAVAMAYTVAPDGDGEVWAAPYDLVVGYQSVLALTEAERTLLPDLVRGRQVQRLLLNAVLATAPTEDPDRFARNLPIAARQLQRLAAPAPDED